MILGWQFAMQNGLASVGCWILVDSIFPWPGLHHGRNAMREFVNKETEKRKQGIGSGLRKYSGIQSTVKEMDGDVELRVWPCTKQFMTRQWTDHDKQWRPVINTIAQLIGQEIKCGVRVDWQASDLVSLPVPMTKRPKSLQGIEGFMCWKKGEMEPTAQFIRGQSKLASISGIDLTFM